MELLTHKSPKRKFFKGSIFTVLVALVIVFACEVEDPIPTYTLTTTSFPAEGGKITVSPQVPNHPEGSQVTVTPEPNEHWVFKQWEGDVIGNTNPLQVTMTANISITGVFVKRDYPLNLKIEGEGTVDEKIVPNPSGREYPHGTRVELKPIPKEGWVFESWGGDLSGNASPQIIIVDKEKNVIVKFKRKDYPLNITITGEGTVEEKIISTPGGRTYPFQTVVQLTPKAKEGWEFESWAGDLIGKETPKVITVDKEKNVTVNFIKTFMGYKVAANARQLGTEYWENTPVLSDLMIFVFQKNFEDFGPPYAYTAWTQGICNGDFNNDGYIDVFNAGSAYGGQKSRLSFLIWNPTTKIFEEKNLINNKTDFIGMPTKVSPIYLNQDDYVDLVIFGHMDESSPNNRIEPITICLSDGKGGYDLTELVLQPLDPNKQVIYEHGSVADLNGDKLPDLLIMANSLIFVFWGIPTYPYFSNIDYVKLQMNESAFYCKIKDLNKDGINDPMIGTNINNQIFLNDGKGAIFTNKITVPYPTVSTNSMNVFDYIVDDLNLDGLNYFINISATNHKNWSIEVYIQQSDGSFKRETSWIEYTLSINRTDWRNKLIYFDFDGDGKKDITYSDTGNEPYTSPTSEMKNKTVFIRNGNKFIEKDYYQFDPYAKSLKDKYYK